MKALIIGGGQIGALYNHSGDNIDNHLKAYLKNPNISSICLVDHDPSVLACIPETPDLTLVSSLSDVNLNEFNIASICTPTNTHIDILKMIIGCGIKTIICEKPVSLSIDEIQEVEELYKIHPTKVIINYIRRYHPVYRNILEKLQEIQK